MYSDGKGGERALGELGSGSIVRIYCMKNICSQKKKNRKDLNMGEKNLKTSIVQGEPLGSL